MKGGEGGCGEPATALTSGEVGCGEPATALTSDGLDGVTEEMVKTKRVSVLKRKACAVDSIRLERGTVAATTLESGAGARAHIEGEEK
jgi:hypothetical protein